jgi:hypothetical protein
MPDDRPFLIVGGTAVKAVGSEYPRLIPVEYTPLYTGIRQRFRAWAAPTCGRGPTTGWRRRRARAPKSWSARSTVDRMFTLADVIGSGGAAPQLELMLGSSYPPSCGRHCGRPPRPSSVVLNLAVRGEGGGSAGRAVGRDLRAATVASPTTSGSCRCSRAACRTSSCS